MAVISELKILLVDDQKGIRDLARLALEEAGISQIIEAKHGEHALEVIRGEDVDLIISDWNMQPLDGLELLKTLRADAALNRIPFILMTGQFEDDDVMTVEKAGVDSYVKKPFDATTVREKIEQVIGPLDG